MRVGDQDPAQDQGGRQRDWPSERFESLWDSVASGGPPVVVQPDWSNPPVDSWVFVQGKLEQRTPLGAVHPGGEEWFVRDASGVAVAAYLVDAPQASAGTRVCLVGRVLGSLRLADRTGELRAYPAVVGRALLGADGRLVASVVVDGSRVNAPGGAAPAGVAGDWSMTVVSGCAVAALLLGWFAVRHALRRSGGEMDRIHAVAARARSAGGPER